MQRSSDFSLFFQTAIAIVGFLVFLSVTATILTPSTNASKAPAATIEVANR